jgi:hypothetical protein
VAQQAALAVDFFGCQAHAAQDGLAAVRHEAAQRHGDEHGHVAFGGFGRRAAFAVAAAACQ